ncbi:hypothetical protein D9Q98_008128 [Chlorella vulgaris]|uniref:Uncharacterized protein n=1 Tax=Chlorella vulgaris TaxID=3077 RepID=A0A9D4TG07_CHLVU|nr:hypothetical protein D9Q98_008128 [Chlorella vulgaris]
MGAPSSSGPPPPSPFDQNGSTSAGAQQPPEMGASYPPGAPPSVYPPPGATSSPAYQPAPSAHQPGPVPGAPVMMNLSPHPIPGMLIRPPRVPPQPGQILVGYETCQPVGGCCVCDGLSAGGVIAIVILILVFWPLAWIPCVMPECYDPYQRPVYGYPPPQFQPQPQSQQQSQPQQASAGYPPAAF